MADYAYPGSVLDPWTLLDLSRFSQSRGDGALVRLISAFSREADARVAGLCRAVADGDTAEAGEIAHGLRGSSLALAAKCVAERCAEIEAAASRGESGSILNMAGQLRVDLDDAFAALELVFGAGARDGREER